MLHRPAFTRARPAMSPADRSMVILQYVVALIALVVAVALALGH